MPGPLAPEVAAAGDHFARSGRPWFYLADTVWSAFTNPTPEEWEQYLDVRAEQGFNVLQIDVLPQWDRSRAAGPSLEPFPRRGDGNYDWGRPNAEYFDRARALLAAATARGFVPALAVLWCDYVPGTWAAERLPGHTIAPDEVEPWCVFVAETFSEHAPIFLVSGDTDLKRPETRDTYVRALAAVKRSLPSALTTFHLNPDTDLPDEIALRPELDFYMYQSGHHAERQDRSWTLAEQFLSKAARKPVVNGEPCYDGHGHGHAYGRFGAFDVRRAIWGSLLAGAKAGVTYGAHGIWGWHRPGSRFPGTEFSGEPYPWYDAMRLAGAWDAGFARWIFEIFGLFGLEPLAVRGVDPAIRFAASRTGDKVAVYLPAPAALPLPWALEGLDCVLIDLAERRYLTPRLAWRDGRAQLGLSGAAGDCLLVGAARKEGGADERYRGA